MSSLAECEILPFDLPEAEEEFVAGYQTEYSGIKLKYKIRVLLSCFLPKSISLFIICNSSLLRWVEFFYSVHISY